MKTKFSPGSKYYVPKRLYVNFIHSARSVGVSQKFTSCFNDEKAIELVSAYIDRSGKAENFRFKCDNHTWYFSDGNDFFLPAEEYVQEEMEL